MNLNWDRRHVRQISVAIAAFFVVVVAGCGGSGNERTAPPVVVNTPGSGTTAPTSVDLDVHVIDVVGEPIEGATVAVTSGGLLHQVTTGADGIAVFPDLPIGDVSLAVSAAGFESVAWDGAKLDVSFPTSRVTWSISLDATGAWAVGRAIVLGTRVVELAADGGEMTFELDMAVIGENSEAVQTLTSDDFSLSNYECGWAGARDCASDSEGRPTGASGQIWSKGGAQQFGLQPPSPRQPYLVGVLAERSTEITDWDERGPAMKAFFSGLGGNDVANLASVQVENNVTTLNLLGPYTGAGSTYLEAIDQLALPAGIVPEMLESLHESIRGAAEASRDEFPGTEPFVLVVSTPWMTLSEIYATAELANQLGVRISTITGNYSYPYGSAEVAVRTGGFVADIGDSRQLGIVFGAMDGLLAGTTPFYRMQFQIGGEPHTFVSGGNAKVFLRVRVPTSIPHRGVYTSLDVAIP